MTGPQSLSNGTFFDKIHPKLQFVKVQFCYDRLLGTIIKITISSPSSPFYIPSTPAILSLCPKMHPHLSHSLLLIFILIGISIHFPTSLCADDERYTNCSKTFTCGNIPNIGYPFWGVDLRSEYCGHPGFELNCSGEEPQITIGSLNHQVVSMNQDSSILTVARTDYLENLCPQHFFNNSLVTGGVFDYTSDSQEARLYYKCVSMIPSVTQNRFACDINSTTSVNYFATENIIRGQNNIIPGVNSTTLGTCEESVIVRASDSAVADLETAFGRSTVSTSNMVDALKAGYYVKWDANNSRCEDCQTSGGHCGFNSTTAAFSCFCKDTAHSLSCNDESNSSPASDSGKGGGSLSTKTGLYIAGACILGIGIGLYVFFLINRRKKKRALVAQSKDLPPTPSSKSLITPSTNFSQSIPSYPSSKSDIEKGSFYFGVQVFSYSELEEATDNFDASRELGEGGFGTVYYGKLHDGRVVAVKRLFENNFKRVEQFMNEVEILTRLGHKNLVKLYGCTSRRSRELLLVYEFIPNGTVADHLHGKKNSSDGFLSWPVRLSIAIETADALAYLHRSDIIHRDVKTNNILLDNEFQVKVADFGLSRLFPTDVTHVSTAPQGTPGYVDPEYYQCYQLTSKSDVYSFGVVLIELISSLPAVDTNRHRHDINLANMAINKIQNHALNELVDPILGFDKDYNVRRMATAVAELAFRCLQQERDMRPTMDEVVAALKAIENQEFGSQTAEVVDIRSDDVGLLKSMPPPFSPDSIVNAKWVSSSTQSMPPPISPDSVVNAKWVSNSTPPNSI